MYARAERKPSLQKLGPSTDVHRLRIEPVPDMLRSSIPKRDVYAMVQDPAIQSLWWELRDPGDRSVKQQTTGGSRFESFPIEPADFAAPGVYHLTCVGLDPSGLAQVQAVRDFRIVHADLAAAAGASGTLQFTKYQKNDAPAPGQRYRVDTDLKFHPHPSVDCAQIGWLQTAQALGGMGKPLHANVAGGEVDARQTPLAWTIDRVSGAPSPFYGTDHDTQGNLVTKPGLGHFGSTAPARTEAMLQDAPEFEGAATIRYESCAVCRATPHRGQVYGCATWGFSATSAGIITLHPRSYSLMPSPEFRDAHAMWNLKRGTREEAPELQEP